MTYLLLLLKQHRPDACYDSLPNTGKELLKIDGFDFPTTSGKRESKKFTPPVKIDNGKYVHFGLENALNGDLPGLVHRDAELLQYVPIYTEEKNLLPPGTSKIVI